MEVLILKSRFQSKVREIIKEKVRIELEELSVQTRKHRDDFQEAGRTFSPVSPSSSNGDFSETNPRTPSFNDNDFSEAQFGRARRSGSVGITTN